jgi:imidazole glycerol-phosphate synthase subunit HisF
MLRSRIIPSLLIRNRGLVKTKQFRDDKYVGDPINAVKIFNEKQVDELAIFDIDASAKREAPNFDLLKSIAVESRMPLCYGGGITSAEQARRLIASGFEKVSISAAALERPELIREIADSVGTQSVVVTIDVRKTGLFGKHSIYSLNGNKHHKTKPLEFAALAENNGAGELVINSIDRDGMMQGYDIEFAKLVRATVNIPMTVLGGAGTIDHMRTLTDAVGTVGAAAGSMFVFKGPYRAVLISYDRP